jgi:hypothetical protein
VRPILPLDTHFERIALLIQIPKGLSAAFHDVQFQAEVRRAVPLSLKLTRLGGAPMLEGLVRALRGLVS